MILGIDLSLNPWCLACAILRIEGWGVKSLRVRHKVN